MRFPNIGESGTETEWLRLGDLAVLDRLIDRIALSEEGTWLEGLPESEIKRRTSDRSKPDEKLDARRPLNEYMIPPQRAGIEINKCAFGPLSARARCVRKIFVSVVQNVPHRFYIYRTKQEQSQAKSSPLAPSELNRVSENSGTWLAPEPILEEPPRDRIAPRQAEIVIVLVREEPALLVPARILELGVIDLDRGRARARMKAEHQRGRERPRLRGVIGDLVERHLGLLIDFARHRLLEAFARLDEASQGRVHALRPG